MEYLTILVIILILVIRIIGDQKNRTPYGVQKPNGLESTDLMPLFVCPIYIIYLFVFKMQVFFVIFNFSKYVKFGVNSKKVKKSELNQTFSIFLSFPFFPLYF